MMRRKLLTCAVASVLLHALSAVPLHVKVLDFASGKPLAGATITLLELDIQDYTDKEGAVVFDIDPGSYTLRAEADQHTTTDTQVKLGQEELFLTVNLAAEAVLEQVEVKGRVTHAKEEKRLIALELQDLPLDGGSVFNFARTLPSVLQLPKPKVIAGSMLGREAWFLSSYGASGSWNRYFYDYLRLPSGVRLSGDLRVKHASIPTQLVKELRVSPGISFSPFPSALGLTMVAVPRPIPTPTEMRSINYLSGYQLEQLNRKKSEAWKEKKKREQEKERRLHMLQLPEELRDLDGDGLSDKTGAKLYDVDRDGYPDVAGDIFMDKNQDGFSDIAKGVPLYDTNGDGKYDFYGDIFQDKNRDGISDLSGLQLFDTNGDGKYDVFGDPLTDRNKDGFSDLLGEPLYDLNEDGVYDAYGDILADNNHDGFSDATGYRLVDSDGDGQYDALEVLPREEPASPDNKEHQPALQESIRDENHDGLDDDTGEPLIDLDGDGTYDVAGYAFVDENGDDISDTLQTPLHDIDNDGVFDEVGLELVDEDKDGYSDLTGAYLVDSNGDGQFDKAIPTLQDDDFNGISDANGYPLVDLNDDGIFDTYDSGSLNLPSWQQGGKVVLSYRDGPGIWTVYRLGVLGLSAYAEQSIDPVSFEPLANLVLQGGESTQPGSRLISTRGWDGQAQLRATLSIEDHQLTVDLIGYYDNQDNKYAFKGNEDYFELGQKEEVGFFSGGARWKFLTLGGVQNNLTVQFSHYGTYGQEDFSKMDPREKWNARYDGSLFALSATAVEVLDRVSFPLGSQTQLLVNVRQRLDAARVAMEYQYSNTYPPILDRISPPSYVDTLSLYQSAATLLLDWRNDTTFITGGVGGSLLYDTQDAVVYPNAELEAGRQFSPEFSMNWRGGWSQADYDGAELMRVRAWERAQMLDGSTPSDTDWRTLPQGFVTDLSALLTLSETWQLQGTPYFAYYLYRGSFFPFMMQERAADSYSRQLADVTSGEVDDGIAFGLGVSLSSNPELPLTASLGYSLGWSLFRLKNNSTWMSADNDVRHVLDYILSYRFDLGSYPAWKVTLALSGDISIDHPYDPAKRIEDTSVANGGDLDENPDRQVLSRAGSSYNSERSWLPQYSLFLRLNFDLDYNRVKKKKKLSFFIQTGDLLGSLQLSDSDLASGASDSRFASDRKVSVLSPVSWDVLNWSFGLLWQF